MNNKKMLTTLIECAKYLIKNTTPVDKRKWRY